MFFITIFDRYFDRELVEFNLKIILRKSGNPRNSLRIFKNVKYYVEQEIVLSLY